MTPLHIDLRIMTEAQKLDFWSKVDKTPGYGPKGECWKWIGPTNNHRYGQIWIGRGSSRQKCLSHRLIHKWFGQLRVRDYVLHRCDNSSCVNPLHLYVGTKKENSQDMVKKGRSAVGDRNGSKTCPESICRGEEITQSKVTEKDVRYIRSSKERKKDLAEMFGLTYGQIWNIQTRRSWKHVA